ncbi:hypothetical protein CVS41_14210 [Aeromonas veronii]|nr:O-antigen polymerase [Aeromonas veronii]ATY78194.1 hypothetical protein CVS41_14210 [Aeromonas veronii]
MTLKKSISFLILHAILAVSFIAFFLTPVDVDLSYQRIVLLLVFIAAFLFFKTSNINGNWLSFNVIFIFGYFVVFFQIILLQQFGYYLPAWSYKQYWSDPKIENMSLVVSAVAIILYMIGHLYSNIFKNKRYVAFIPKETDSILLLLIIVYLSYLGFFATAGSYRSGVYYAADAMPISSYFLKIFNASLTAAIIIKLTKIFSLSEPLSLYRYICFFGLPLLLILTWHLGFSLYIGDRGVIIAYGLLFASTYVYKNKKIGFVKLVLVLISASFLLTVVGEVRQSKDKSLTYYEQLLVSLSGKKENSRWYEEKVPGDSFIELAQSGRTLNHSLTNVPSHYDYRYGVYAFKRISGIIPGMQGVVNNIVENGDDNYLSTAEFISYLIQGDNQTYGDGTSITADIYLDFGITGVFIVMFTFGFFIGFNESKFNGDSISYLNIGVVSFFVFYSKSLYLSRSSIFLELSIIFMIWLFLVLNNYFVSRFKKHK